MSENVKMEIPKGTRDFLPREKIIRNYILKTLTETFEEAGFNPLETPAIELLSVMTAKGGNEPGTDAYEEIYKFKDRGGRELGLKFEQTFAFARVIAMNPQLPRPFKRYQIDRAWRNGPIKLGRYREFWQCDIDTVGSDSMIADAEILAIYTKVFEKLGLEVVIKLNNRKLLNGVLEYAGIPENQRMDAIISLDKLEKIGKDEVLKETKEKGISEELMLKAIDAFYQKGTNEEIIEKLSNIDNDLIREALKETKEVLEYAKYLGAEDISFVPFMARGLTYYTGPIYEVYLKSGEVKSSLAGGGRWDNMIGNFMNSDKIVPATGTSFGLDTIYDALVSEKKIEFKESVVEIFVIPIKKLKESLITLNKLRNADIKADIELMNRSISKSLSYANSQKIPFVIFIGENEVKESKVKLRDMESGNENLLSIEDAIDFLKTRKR